MTDFNGFKGRAKRLDPEDYGRIGALIGATEDDMRAFVEVESNGKGFAPDGRPIILNEPHVFYRNLPQSKRDLAVRRGLAYKKWGTKPYPKAQSERYKWLQLAMEIDETAALSACSWGLSQILGENYRAAGYDTVQDMVLAFMDDEEEHLRAAVSFMETNGLDDDLREHRWATFARGWNGPGYKKNSYDTKLRAAHKKWSRIRDIKQRVAGGDFDDVESEYTSADLGGTKLTKAEVRAIQMELRRLKYFTVGKVDGEWGPLTQGALATFQSDNKLPITGVYDEATRLAMAAASPKRIDTPRAATTVEDLREQGSKTIKETDVVKAGAGVVGFGGLVTMATDAVTEWFGVAWGYLDDLKQAFESIPMWVWGGLALALALFFSYRASRIQKVRVDDERLGLHNGEPQPVELNTTRIAPTPPQREE